jgi:hypothetical protein
MSIETASVEDFERALLTLRDDERPALQFDTALRMLRWHYHHPEQTITADQLAARMKWQRGSMATMTYGKLGQQISQYLGYEPPKRRHGDKKRQWWMALSTSAEGQEADHDADGDFRLVMRPNLRAALESMNWTR